jgi:hypothetical protein
LYFGSLNAQEVWFWTVTTTVYLLAIPLILSALTQFISEKKISIILLSIIFFLIGGTVENLIIGVFITLLYGLVIFYKDKEKRKKLLISIISLIVLPIISLLGNGISGKINEINEFYKVDFFKTMFTDYELTFNFKRLYIYLALLIIIVFKANAIKDKINLNVNLKIIFTHNLILLLIILLSTYLPLIKLYGNLGPARASFPFFSILILSSFYWTFIIGLKIKLFEHIYLISSITLLFLLTLFTIKQYKINGIYSLEYDKRIEEILKHKNNSTEYIFVKPLPPSGVIPSADVAIFGAMNGTSYFIARVNGIDKDVFQKTTK